MYQCAGCGAALFDASTKYNSGTGWPSFFQALPGAVTETNDYSIMFMPRTEVRILSRAHGFVSAEPLPFRCVLHDADSRHVMQTPATQRLEMDASFRARMQDS